MNFFELLILAIALSMDAFAVAVSIGLTVSQKKYSAAIMVAAYFGFFQAAMPIVGFFAASLFADGVAAYSHLISFGLLAFIGGKMVWESFKKEKVEASLTAKNMILLSFATSIDAMAVGVSFAVRGIDIFAPIIVIGAVTFVLAGLGVIIGSVFGDKYRAKATFAGGIILVAIGINILIRGIAA
jgi:putative Mn2+ efflux pump MntP